MFTVTMWAASILGFFFTALCLRLINYIVKKSDIEDEPDSCK
ncbi:MAG: hypothetical protein Q8878_02260 [Bacillota bacterium]|nr:hypothetical protein [Bacillota bacterium]